jgi:hypothetical protein
VRIVLAAEHGDDWRTYRQPQWIGLVRGRPDAAGWPRHHFDVDETAYLALLERWNRDRLGGSLDSALAALRQAGVAEIAGPG